MARSWALQLAPGAPSRLARIMYLLSKGGKTVPPFYEASHVRGRWRAPLLAEPDQTPHITMWHYGYGRLLRCGCAGSMRREGYGGCAGAVVLGYGRSAPLNTAVECSSSPQHSGSKATGRPAWAPRLRENPRGKVCTVSMNLSTVHGMKMRTAICATGQHWRNTAHRSERTAEGGALCLSLIFWSLHSS